MAKITISEPDGPYSATLDTEAMAVEIKEAFIGVRFVTADGEELAVFMRDGGFELRYSADYDTVGFTHNLELKGGQIKT